ncbi:MAG: DUF2293 domain-containing protein [Desulfobacterales bacterium]|nr:DUF2293 domain-containing protein [Desulfobacterales bacterium]
MITRRNVRLTCFFFVERLKMKKKTPKKAEDLKVFISNRASTCEECGENMGRKAWITLVENKGAHCLSCADLDHLVFLAAGNAALTRRSRKYSTLSAVVLKWSRPRKRYERQGLLVEAPALERAERECLADSDVRARRRERAAARRAVLDKEYVEEFARRVRELYPGRPSGRAKTIAEHACLKYSGRVGRSAAAKTFDPKTVRLAVAAHVRHQETKYDVFLVKGMDRYEARARVKGAIDRVMEKWRA